MCEFFSFLTDGKGSFYYADAKMRKNARGREGKINRDSHTWLGTYFLKNGNEDSCNKYEFNPFSGQFQVDQINIEDLNDSESAEKWVRELTWSRVLDGFKPIRVAKFPWEGAAAKNKIKDCDKRRARRWIKTVKAAKEDMQEDVVQIVLNAVYRKHGYRVYRALEEAIDILREDFDSNSRGFDTSLYPSQIAAYFGQWFDIDFGVDLKDGANLFHKKLLVVDRYGDCTVVSGRRCVEKAKL